MPGYRIPSASASSAAHHGACAASLAREMEAWKYAEANGIDGLMAGGAAERGTDLHNIAAALPFASDDFGAEPYDIRAETNRLAAASGYSGYEAFLVSDFIRRRDQAINYALDHFPGGRNAVESIDLMLDEKRLEAVFGKHPYSGLPDVLAIISGKGHTIGVVADYKSGMSERKHASDNRQVAALVGLTKHNYPAVSEVYGAVISEEEMGTDVALAHFPEAQVLAAHAYVERVATNVGAPLDLYLAGKAVDPAPVLDQKLNELAKPGPQCLECRGRTCCGKMQEKLVGDYFGTIDRLSPLLVTYKTLEPTMNPEKLSEVLALATAVTNTSVLYNRLREDGETLVRQLHAKGIAVPGVEITSSPGRIGLTETDLSKLHAALEPTLGGQSLINFALAVGKPSATALRAHMAGIMSVAEPKVEETLNTLLGEPANPLKKGAPIQSVNVTRDLADILDEKRAEITSRAPAAKPEIIPDPKVSVATGTTPLATPSTAPAEAAAPRARRSRQPDVEPQVKTEAIGVPLEAAHTTRNYSGVALL